MPRHTIEDRYVKKEALVRLLESKFPEFTEKDFKVEVRGTSRSACTFRLRVLTIEKIRNGRFSFIGPRNLTDVSRTPLRYLCPPILSIDTGSRKS